MPHADLLAALLPPVSYAPSGPHLAASLAMEGRELDRVQADAAHAAAEFRQIHAGSESVFRGPGAEGAVVGQHGHLLRERRVVGQHLYRILVHMQAIGHGLHRDAAGAISDEPVQLCRGQLGVKWDVHKVQLGQQGAYLVQVGALAQQPGNQFKGRYVVLALRQGLIIRIAREI